MANEPESGRIPPRERFAPSAIQLDLNSATASLIAEANEGQRGHRQIALYKHGQATVALFRFEQGGALPAHQAPGTVFIHVLDGHIELDVEGTVHSLPKGELLVLAPGVRHDVNALQASTMLLTVCLDSKQTAPG